MITWRDRRELSLQLEAAIERLATFESETIHGRYVERVQATRPRHPLLVVRGLSLVGAFLISTSGVFLMLATTLLPDVAELASQFNSASALFLPISLGLLATCCLLFAFCAHLGLLLVGESLPLLPREAWEHRRLFSEVNRLEAMLAVQMRYTTMELQVGATNLARLYATQGRRGS